MPSEFERAVLNYESERLGRFSKVTSHSNADESLSIPVALAADSPQGGLTTVATIGLSRYDNDLVSDSGSPLRVELLLTGRSEYSFLAGALANAALNIASNEYRGAPGAVYSGILDGYDPKVTTPHGLLWYPFSWEPGFSGLELDGLQIEWLLVIPITESELEFIAERGPGTNGAGVSALIDAFEANSTDIWNLERDAAIG